MKTKTVYALMGVVSILTIARVDAATVFTPTDGDVNFLFGDLAGGVLAMFDDSDQSYGGVSLTIDVPGIVGVAGPVNTNGDHIASNSNGTLTLTGSDNYILGLNVGGIWFAVSSVVAVGANSYTVFFANNGASVLQVDAQVMPAVPLPAAVWLFGSGLLGLVGSAVRRKARVT